AVMVTVGGAISGYWAIGSTCEATRPATVIMIDMTPAKIGREMKKLNMEPALLRRGGRVLRRIVQSGLCFGRRHGADRGAGPQLEQVVDDDAVSGRQAACDDPVRADPVTDLHRPHR